MKDEIIELIKSSRAIKNSEKESYLKLLDSLDEDKKKRLFAILKKEERGSKQIENEAFSEKNLLNKSFMDKVSGFFKDEEKKFVSSEEKEEQLSGENLLTKLDEL
ncbi:MAG: hypothetical protein NTZ25_05255 [Candidatus Peregrinibacteria bacterium]|nr:hypothetical protein [Candidatus Peregrinibacteria bacterium]